MMWLDVPFVWRPSASVWALWVLLCRKIDSSKEKGASSSLRADLTNLVLISLTSSSSLFFFPLPLYRDAFFTSISFHFIHHLKMQTTLKSIESKMSELSVVRNQADQGPSRASVEDGHDTDSLFDTKEWISGSGVQESLPSGLTIRPLRRSDFDRGFLTCLAQLTKVGEIAREQFQGTFSLIDCVYDLIH